MGPQTGGPRARGSAVGELAKRCAELQLQVRIATAFRGRVAADA